MVLQRGTGENRIWGYAAPGAILSVSLLEAESLTGVREPSHFERTRADVQGYFSFLLPLMNAGGPWEIVITCGEEKRILEDIYFGDVFLLGGQSNMELPLSFPSLKEKYQEEIEAANFTLIRQFEVPKEYDFHEERLFLSGGKWVSAVGEDLLGFSAAGFFAAKKIYERYKIPIGLYQTAVGGTPVKAWCSPETVQRLGYDVKELLECADDKYVKRTLKTDEERNADWRERAMEPFGRGRVEGESKYSIPGLFRGTALENFTGSLLFKKTIMLDENMAAESAILHFGTMIDADEIWVNGVCVGESEHRYLPRIYHVPAGTFCEGANEIEVRLLVFQPGGGFMPGKEYDIVFEHGEKISLAGEWSYTKTKALEPLEPMTFFQYKASGTYRAMICPLQKQICRGVFFYQGESNTERPETYEEEFTAMIQDWRTLFKNQTLPFIFVQLAQYSDGIEHAESDGWDELREVQKKCSETISNVAMVQAYDLGEYNDLHPSRKQELGDRIADAAFDVIYRQEM